MKDENPDFNRFFVFGKLKVSISILVRQLADGEINIVLEVDTYLIS
jgi:hypothetical protein